MARQEFYIAHVQYCVEEIKNLTALDSILKGKPITGPPFPPFFPFLPSDFAGNDAQEGLTLIQAPGMGLDRLCLFQVYFFLLINILLNALCLVPGL